MEQTNEKYKWVVLGSLTVVYVFNFIDRQILVILQEPIKAELGLSDTQLGLLTGLTFAALYVTLGIPIARFADKSNRKNIVAGSLAFWSAMTMLSGMAGNFMQLFWARMGVGVGEAGGSPPAHSIISDYFPIKKRATALSIYSTGIYIGILCGFLIGGVLAKNFGWRISLYSLGFPGILYAIYIFFKIKEPIRGLSDASFEATNSLSLKSVVTALFKKKTFVFLSLATGFNTFGIYGIGNFLPSFLQRVHHIELAKVGIILGLAMGIGGGIGTFFGGYLADKNSHKDMRWYIWVPIASILTSLFFTSFVFFAENPNIVYISIFIMSLLTATYLGPTIAVTHSLVKANMRSFSSAILFFILNLIGLGFGPLAIGIVSDLLRAQHGDHSLRYAFCITYLSAAISVGLFYLGSKTYLKDLENV